MAGCQGKSTLVIFSFLVATLNTQRTCRPDFMPVKGKQLLLCKRFIWRNLPDGLESRVLAVPKKTKDTWIMCLDGRLQSRFQIRFLHDSAISAVFSADLADQTVVMEDQRHGKRPTTSTRKPDPFPWQSGEGSYFSAQVSNHIIQYTLCGESTQCKTFHHSIRDSNITKVQIVGPMTLSMVNTWCLPDLTHST